VRKAGAAKRGQRVKYLHVIPPRQNIIYPFVRMVLDSFERSEHFFLVTHTDETIAPQLAECENTAFLPKGSRLRSLFVFYRQLKNAQYIIWHSLYLKPCQVLLLGVCRGLLRKSAWVEWGKDLYHYETAGKSILHLLYNALQRRIREQMVLYVAIFPPDEQVFRERLHSRAPVMHVSYLAPDAVHTLEKTRPARRETDGCVHVQVAHSCNPWNHHADILDDLARFRDEDIRLHIPLGTGYPPKNARDIARRAAQMFGEKADCIMEEVEKEDYLRFLWNMDIVVFRLYRQAALGNLLRLLYMGKKVYLPGGTAMYDFFIRQGAQVFDAERIPQMSFEEFAAPLQDSRPPRFLLELMMPDKLIGRWRAVFEALERLSGGGA